MAKKQTKIEVEVKTSSDGLRYGTLSVGDFKEQFPKQVITSTNINHLEELGLDQDCLGTEITEIYLKLGQISANAIAERMSNNELHLLNAAVPAGTKLTYADILKIIDAQVEAELPIIRVYLTTNISSTQALNLIDYALSNGHVEPMLDLDIYSVSFKQIYEGAIEKGIKLVGVISRGFDDINVLANMNFIRGRMNDNIIRQVSWINARTRAERDYIRSFVYYLFGFDLCGFLTKRAPNNMKRNAIKQLSPQSLIYVPIAGYGKCSCVAHAGQDCVKVAEEYGEPNKPSTIPSSVHTIRTINDVFQAIYDGLAKKESVRALFLTPEINLELAKIERLLIK